jgi:signal peptidase I
MEPALAPDDVLIVTKMPIYSRGDIVAFRPPPDVADGGVPFIKRVIGLPGETVAIRDGGVTVDASLLSEPYVYPGHDPRDPTTVTGNAHSWVIPQGQVFLLGDHRAASADSRTFGPVSIEAVIGRVTWRCTPSPGPIGSN